MKVHLLVGWLHHIVIVISLNLVVNFGPYRTPIRLLFRVFRSLHYLLSFLLGRLLARRFIEPQRINSDNLGARVYVN